MHRLLFGLALVSLMACSDAFAGDPTNSDSAGAPAVQKPPAPSRLRAPKTVKPVARTQSDRHSEPRPLPLSSAAAYASEHAADLPISSAPKTTPPSSSPWTGFYVGVGAGVGHQQP
jgi:hypothetical protein